MSWEPVCARNIDHYHQYCSQKSIELLEGSIKNQIYPSRHQFFLILLSEIVRLPFQPSYKIYEIGTHILHFICLNVSQREYQASIKPLKNLILVASYHFLNSLAVLLIRIFSVSVGLVFQKWAIQGMIYAEKRAVLSSQSWDRLTEKIPLDPDQQERVAFKEILPSSALFYLGSNLINRIKQFETKTNPDREELNEKIAALFEHTLVLISRENALFFENTFFCHLNRRKRHSEPCIINTYTKNLLFILTNKGEISKDVDMIKEIVNIKDLKKMEFVFNHLALNLKYEVCKGECQLSTMISQNLLVLGNYFSLQRFGTATFRYPLSSLQVHHRIY